VITVGVDLASQALRTAACQIQWRQDAVEVDLPETGVDDARILELALLGDKLGIDVPLGWPEAFVAAVSAHHESKNWTERDQRALRFRETDRVVYQETKRWPLSVSTDRIAMPAMRAAWLLGALNLAGTPVDRAGRGKVVEVYPAAALRRWGLPATGYKKKDLISALVARAAACDLCEAIPADAMVLAKREGWIALPRPDSLERLAEAT
jgi:predicted nuclease with RNAse H fold